MKTFTHQLSSDVDFLWQSTTLSCYLKPSYVFKVNSVYCSLLCRLKYNNLLSLQDLEIFSLIWNAFSILKKKKKKKIKKQTDSISSNAMGLQEEFEEHAEKAKTLPENTTNENKLILYGLFKQATVGPVNTSRPGIFNMRDRAKWDAWKAVEGKSKEEAMSDYITKVKQLLEEAAASA